MNTFWPRREKTCLRCFRQSMLITSLLSYRDLVEIRILLVASLDMILCNKRITKALIRLRGAAGWSAPLLFARASPEDRFSCDKTHLTNRCHDLLHLQHSFLNKTIHYILLIENCFVFYKLLALVSLRSFCVTYSGNPDQTSQNAASDQDLHCLQNFYRKLKKKYNLTTPLHSNGLDRYRDFPFG